MFAGQDQQFLAGIASARAQAEMMLARVQEKQDEIQARIDQLQAMWGI